MGWAPGIMYAILGNDTNSSPSSLNFRVWCGIEAQDYKLLYCARASRGKRLGNLIHPIMTFKLEGLVLFNQAGWLPRHVGLRLSSSSIVPLPMIRGLYNAVVYALF